MNKVKIFEKFKTFRMFTTPIRCSGEITRNQIKRRMIMKKLICMLLALTAVFGLCACGKDGSTSKAKEKEEVYTGPTGPYGTPIATEAPTEEERELLEQYYDLMKELGGEKDPLRLKEIYQQLQELEGVDKFYGTEYASNEYLEDSSGYLMTTNYLGDVDWDRRGVLARFTIVKDVKLKITEAETDNLGNVSNESTRISWDYYEDGTVKNRRGDQDERRINVEYVSSGYQTNVHEYDEKGQISKITYYTEDGDIDEIRTFTYGENGKLSRETVKDNYSEVVYSYTYNAGDQLEKVEWSFKERSLYTITYEYDAAGRLTKETKSYYSYDKLDEQWIMEHTYDASGVLTSSKYLELEWSNERIREQTVNEFRYEYDGKGRLVKAVETLGQTEYYKSDGSVSSVHNPMDFCNTYQIIYGDYYGYTPAPAEE